MRISAESGQATATLTWMKYGVPDCRVQATNP